MAGRIALMVLYFHGRKGRLFFVPGAVERGYFRLMSFDPANGSAHAYVQDWYGFQPRNNARVLSDLGGYDVTAINLLDGEADRIDGRGSWRHSWELTTAHPELFSLLYSVDQRLG